MIEIMATIVVWAAALIFNPFGIAIDLSRPAAGPESRTIERSPQARPAPSAKAAGDDCNEPKAVAIHRI